MRNIWRGLLLVALLLLVSATVAAIDTSRLAPYFDSTGDLFPQFDQTQPSTTANVIVVPREGEQGDSHQIAVDGLQPGETITIRILDSAGTQVYSSSRNAGDNGRVQVDIFTTAQDAPGEYAVEVVNSAGNVIGTATFTINATSGLSGMLAITPQTGEAGSTYTFEISNVRPFLDMEVVVLNSINERVFTTQVRATVDGIASVQYTSTPRDSGTYNVVVRAGDTDVAAGTLTVSGATITPEITLVPEAVSPGEDVIVSITGLNPAEVVTVIVTMAGAAVDTIGQTADVNGNVIFILPTNEAQTGIYDVRVLSEQGVTLAQAGYTVSSSDVSFVVTPEQAPVDNMFVFAVTGLEANETVTIELVENDAVVLTRDITSDATGTAVLLLNHTMGLVPGNFTARLVRDGVAIAQSNIIVDAVEGLAINTPTSVPAIAPTAQATTTPSTSAPTISIDPTSGAIPTSYTITASGLQPGSNLTVQIRYQGNVIYTVDGLAGNDGTFTTSVVSEASDPTGEYSVELVQNGAVADSMNFSISAGSAQPTVQAPTQPVQPTQPSAQATATTVPPGGVTINVVPPVVQLGNIFDIRVDGLTPNSEATVSITYQNNPVYDTTRTADNNGTVLVNLQTDGTETPGTYTVVVTQNGSVIASQDFTIGADDGSADATQTPSAASDVTISVNPPSGPIETDHVITVTGLNPNETVQFQLLFGTQVAFDSPRTADATGTFQITMTSNPGDPSGVYTARVLRNGQELATADLTVTTTSALQPQPTQVQATPTQAPADATPLPPAPTQPSTTTDAAAITVDPASGPVGTTYNIAISSLAPNANVTVEVRFGGNMLFTTSRTSDTNGNVILSLNSEEGDVEGTYTVVAIQNGTEVASADFVIGAATGGGTTQLQPTQPPTTTTGEATVNIDPPSGAIGTTHNITVSGLTPNTNVTLEVRFGGNAIFTTSRTSDATGTVILNINSEEGDTEGTYTVVVIQDGTELASGDFVIGSATGGTTQPQPTQPPTSSTGQATVTIDPPSGAIGTTHNITVSGLTPNANVTVEIHYNGAVAYSTPRTADASGNVLLAINSEEGDPEGTYSVVVIENGTQIAADDFVVGAGSVQTPDATPSAATPVPSGVTITVDPQSGAIGTSHTVTITGLEPNETVTLDVSFGGASVYSTPRTADATGATAITLTTEDGDSEGQYTVTVLREATAIASGVFTVGETVTTPEITTGGGSGEPSAIKDNIDASLSTDEPEYRHPFTGEAGETVIIRLTSEDFDGYLILEDADGNMLSQNDDGAGDFNPQIGPYTLPYSGEYVVVATSYNYSSLGTPTAGDFNLTIESISLDIPTVDLGTGSQVTSGRLTADTPSVNYTFSGQEGETILISQDSPDFDTYLVLQDDSGSELISSDDAAGTTNSQIGPYTLPYSGSYTVVASSYSFRSLGESIDGQYTLRIERVTVSAITYGATSTLDLNPTSSVQSLAFDAQAGDVISVLVDGAVDTVLTITDPQGFVVITDDDGGVGFNPEISRYVVPTNGTYSLLVRSFVPGDVGSIQVTLNRDDVRSIDTEVRTVSLNSKQSSDILTLQGTAGSRINLNVSLLSGEVGNMSITVRQGAETLMFYQTFGMPEDIALGFEVTTDGPVSIIVEDFNSAGATLEFSITRSQQ
jgi:hypothetical protein